MKGYAQARFLLAGILAVLVALLVSVQPVASVDNATAVSASVGVNVVVDVTLDATTLGFGSTSPGINDLQPTEYPLNVTIYGNTNVDTNLSVNGDANFTTGTYNFSIGNLTYSNESGGVHTPMTTSYAQGTPTHADWQDISDPSSDITREVYALLDIPSGQAGGSYSASVSIKVGEGSP